MVWNYFQFYKTIKFIGHSCVGLQKMKTERYVLIFNS